MCDVAVGSIESRNEALKTVCIDNIILSNVDQSCLIFNIKTELIAFFKTNNTTLGNADGLVYVRNESFCFAGALETNNKFNHDKPLS